MIRNVLRSAPALAALWALPVVAQPLPVLVPGDSLRLQFHTGALNPRIGVLSDITPFQLTLRNSSERVPPDTVPLDRLRKLEVFRPDGDGRAGRGALIGLVTGFVLVGAIGYATTLDDTEYKGIGIILAPIGGGVGTLVGALVGSGVRRPGWRPVKLPKPVSQ